MAALVSGAVWFHFVEWEDVVHMWMVRRKIQKRGNEHINKFNWLLNIIKKSLSICLWVQQRKQHTLSTQGNCQWNNPAASQPLQSTTWSIQALLLNIKKTESQIQFYTALLKRAWMWFRLADWYLETRHRLLPPEQKPPLAEGDVWSLGAAPLHRKPTSLTVSGSSVRGGTAWPVKWD